jgi:hypothetical protein
MTNDPAQTQQFAEQVTKAVVYALAAVIALYFVLRKKR